MPILEYECAECGKRYDVFHKGKEIEGDIECPHCTSKKYSKLMSVPAAPRMAGTGSGEMAPAACESCCANGSCGMN